MKILLADDSEEKVSELKLYFETHEYNFELEVSYSFKETINKIENNKFDLVMLDMTMPTKTNKFKARKIKTRSLAGKDVLATLHYYGILLPKFIIFSQFSDFGRQDDIQSLDDIYEDLFENYSDFLCGYIKYDSPSDLWKDSLSLILKEEFGK